MHKNPSPMKTLRLALVLLFTVSAARAELRVPAFTAYLEPEVSEAKSESPVSPGNLRLATPMTDNAKVTKDGITGLAMPERSVCWFGEFKRAGNVNVSVVLRLPKKQNQS